MADADTATVPEDQDLVVNLNDSPEEKTEGKPPPVPGPSAQAAPPPPAPDGLAQLNRQLEEERSARAQMTEQARRLAAERDQAMAQAQEAQRRGISTQELYAESQIQAVNEQLEALSGQYEAAMNEGNFKQAAQTQLRMGRIAGQVAVLERERDWLAAQREMAQQPQRPQQRQQQPQPQAPMTPMDRAISGRTPATQQFLRKHPELIRPDGTFKRSAIEAHEKALDADLRVDTPEYFDFIEKSIGGQPMTQEQAPGRQGAPTMAAPVSRTPADRSPLVNAAGEFRLTPKMRQLAQEQGVSPQEWAQNYVKLLNEGRIQPIR